MDIERVRPDSLRCSVCKEFKPDFEFNKETNPQFVVRRGRGYRCTRCRGVSAFDQPRPPSMQGRQQSIFTGRPASSPPPIKPQRPPSYWSSIWLGDEK